MMRRSGWLVGAALLYGALAVWATWPLARGLGDRVVDTVALHGTFGWLGLADIRLVVWALAWDVHALRHDPAALFDANVFYPARWALARSDHFLGNLPLFAPLYLASGNPVFAHQALLLLAFPLAALAMCAAVRTWTGSTAAGFVAGLAFGLAPWRFGQLAHVQVLANFYLPLLLLAVWRVVAAGSRRAWLALAALATVQALCSVYLALAVFAAAGMMLAGTWWAAPVGAWRRAAAAAGALVLAALVVGACSWPYVALARSGAIPHVPHGVTGSGVPLELAAAHPLRTYLLRPRPGSGDGYYFLGWACAALAAVGVLGGRARSAAAAAPPPVAGLTLVLAAGWCLSLGYAWRLAGGAEVPLPLGWVARVAPGFASLRAPIRLGLVAALATAALAGLGYARLERRLPTPGLRFALAVLVSGLCLIETVPRRALPLRPVQIGANLPPVYAWLAAQPPGPVLELPVGFFDHDFLGDVAAVRWQSGYELASTAHWRPLLNGYSGYPPQSFFFLMAIARRLPARDALQDLVDLTGLRWLVVHRAWLAPDARPEWGPELPGLRCAATFADVVAFEVTLAPRADLAARLRDETRRPETLHGLGRTPLLAGAVGATVEALTFPASMLAGGLQGGVLTVRNQGSITWPGFDPAPDGLVGVAYRWQRADGTTTAGSLLTRTGRDVAPGETLRVPFVVAAPREPGSYELLVTLRQDGGPWFDEAAGVQSRTRVDVVPWPAR